MTLHKPKPRTKLTNADYMRLTPPTPDGPVAFLFGWFGWLTASPTQAEVQKVCLDTGGGQNAEKLNHLIGNATVARAAYFRLAVDESQRLSGLAWA